MKFTVPLPFTSADSLAGWAAGLDVDVACADAARLKRAKLKSARSLITSSAVRGPIC
jgi:ABC-type amino acid transport substrate-binding protein